MVALAHALPVTDDDPEDAKARREPVPPGVEVQTAATGDPRDRPVRVQVRGPDHHGPNPDDHVGHNANQDAAAHTRRGHTAAARAEPA